MMNEIIDYRSVIRFKFMNLSCVVHICSFTIFQTLKKMYWLFRFSNAYFLQIYRNELIEQDQDHKYESQTVKTIQFSNVFQTQLWLTNAILVFIYSQKCRLFQFPRHADKCDAKLLILRNHCFGCKCIKIYVIW